MRISVGACRFFSAAACLILVCSAAFPQQAVFINSDPINADVFLDGRPLPGKTPLLITDIQTGTHSVGIRKDGRKPADLVFEIGEGETATVFRELYRSTPVLLTPDNDSFIFRSASDIPAGNSMALPEGTYRIVKENGSTVVTPVYPKENLITVLSTAFPICLGVVAIAGTMEIIENGTINWPHPPVMTGFEIASLIIGITDMALLNGRRNFLLNARPAGVPDAGLYDEAGSLYQRAQRALEAGNMEEAVSLFTALISGYPDSGHFPAALYKLARLHLLAGDTELAAAEFRIIIDSYPSAEIYDRACQSLALIYFYNGEIEKSREYVRRMYFIDPLFSGSAGNAHDADKLLQSWAENPVPAAE